MAIDVASVDATVLVVFGEPLQYTPVGGVAKNIVGLYQAPDVSPESLNVEFIETGPIAFCLRSDVPTPTTQDRLLRRSSGDAFQVKDFQLDEGAITVLDLEAL